MVRLQPEQHLVSGEEPLAEVAEDVQDPGVQIGLGEGVAFTLFLLVHTSDLQYGHPRPD